MTDNWKKLTLSQLYTRSPWTAPQRLPWLIVLLAKFFAEIHKRWSVLLKRLAKLSTPEAFWEFPSSTHWHPAVGILHPRRAQQNGGMHCEEPGVSVLYFDWSSMNGFNCMASYIFHAENCCKNWPGAWWLGGSWNPCPWWHISLSRRRSVTRRQCRRQETQTLEAFIDENILDKKYLGILSGPAVTQEQFSGTEIDLLSQ